MPSHDQSRKLPAPSEVEKEARPYRLVYLVYRWREPRGDPTLPPVWRYRVEDAVTHEQHLFGEFSALVEFLRTQEMRA